MSFAESVPPDARRLATARPSRHRHAVAPFLFGCVFSVLAATPLGAAQLDSLAARRLLEEAAAALDDAPSLRANHAFVRHLSGLRARVGLPPIAVVGLKPSERVDSLIAAGALSEAMAAVRLVDDDVWAPVRVIRALAAAGQVETAITFADSLNLTPVAVVEILRASGPDAPSRAEKIRIVRARLGRPALRDAQVDILRHLLKFIAAADFHAAWAETDTVADASDRAWHRLVLLDEAARQPVTLADSLVAVVYAEISRLPDDSHRNQKLAYLGSFCGRSGLAACEGLRLPPQRPGNQLIHLTNRVLNGLGSLEMAEAEPVLDSLRTLIPEDRVTLIVLQALTHDRCDGFGCGPRRDSILTAWLPRAERQAHSAQPLVADSLTMFHAALLATREPTAAWAAAERIDDDSLRARAFTEIAVRLFGLDDGVAWRAAQRAAADYHLDRTLHEFYLDFMADGDDVSAEQALLMMQRTSNRLRAGFAWADRLQRSGQWRAAADFALRVLEYWDPPRDTMAGSRGHFNVFARLGTYDELIEWARAVPDSADRAVALAAVVESQLQ